MMRFGMIVVGVVLYQSSFAQWQVNHQVNKAAPVWVNHQVDLGRAGFVLPNGSIDNHNYPRPLSPLELRTQSPGGFRFGQGVTFGPSRYSDSIWYTTGKLYINGYDAPRALPSRYSAPLTAYGSDPFRTGSMPLMGLQSGKEDPRSSPWGVTPSPLVAPLGSRLASGQTPSNQTPMKLSVENPNRALPSARTSPGYGFGSRSGAGARFGSAHAGSESRSLTGSSSQDVTQVHPDRMRFRESMKNWNTGLLDMDLAVLKDLSAKYFEWSETRYAIACELNRRREDPKQVVEAYADYIRTCPQHTEVLRILSQLHLTASEKEELMAKFKATRKEAKTWTVQYEMTWKMLVVEATFGRLEDALVYREDLARLPRQKPEFSSQLRVKPDEDSALVYWHLKTLRTGGTLKDSRLTPACREVQTKNQ